MKPIVKRNNKSGTFEVNHCLQIGQIPEALANANDTFNEAFFERRLRYAWEFRKSVLREEDLSCCRIIFGEADQFPGLTVDRFGDILVTQTLSLGIEKLKPVIFPLLVKILQEDGQKISGIYERNDVSIRALEGMDENTGFYPVDGLLTDSLPERTQIIENGVKYFVVLGPNQEKLEFNQYL